MNKSDVGKEFWARALSIYFFIYLLVQFTSLYINNKVIFQVLYYYVVYLLARFSINFIINVTVIFSY